MSARTASERPCIRLAYLVASRRIAASSWRNDSFRLSSGISGSGAILEMLSGQIYRVDDVDQVDSALCLAADDLLICTKSIVYKEKHLTLYTVINKDESGEEVSAERLK
jgi:hypothetical protein